jgi:hypothetical protein
VYDYDAVKLKPVRIDVFRFHGERVYVAEDDQLDASTCSKLVLFVSRLVAAEEGEAFHVKPSL